MHAINDHVFMLPSVHALLKNELRSLAPELAGVFGRQGLFVRSHAMAPDEICAPMLGRWVSLYAGNIHGLSGDLECSPQELPFVDDSFRVILVQHACERLMEAMAFRSELARVLEPGGIVIATGFHPFSPWRLWLAWQQRRYIDRLRLSSVGRWRDDLAQAGVLTYSVWRIGNIWRFTHGPSAPSPPRGSPSTLLSSLRPSYVLLARKRVLGMTPRRVMQASRERAVRPQFASSQRTRA